MKEITDEEYQKAFELVRKYEYQQKPNKIHVCVTYKAEISVNLVLPEKWSIEQIKEELKGGPYYTLERDDEDEISYGKIIELIVDGDEIKL